MKTPHHVLVPNLLFPQGSLAQIMTTTPTPQPPDMKQLAPCPPTGDHSIMSASCYLDPRSKPSGMPS